MSAMASTSSARGLVLGEQPPRADAERNVDALLRATRDFVIAGDLNPTAAQIAAKAGVGVGTLYRRAVRKEVLLAAVLVDLLDEVSAHATDIATASSWAAFKDFAAQYIRIRQVTCKINHALEAEFDGAVAAAMSRTRDAFGALADRLHHVRLLDNAVAAEDLMILLASVEITDNTLGLRPDTERRHRVLDRILDSLRPATEPSDSP
jgi:AcrR family transcriptional regulator